MRACDVSTIAVDKSKCEQKGCSLFCPFNTLVFVGDEGQVEDITVMYPFSPKDYDGATDNRETYPCAACGEQTTSGYCASIGGGKRVLYFCKGCAVMKPRSLTLSSRRASSERLEILL
jgi:hypothetical protein